MDYGNISTLNLTQICRTCLLECCDMESVYSIKEIGDATASLDTMISACSFLKMVKDDGFPDKICKHCVAQITSAYKFKRKCERTDHILKTYQKTKQNDRFEEKCANISDTKLNFVKTEHENFAENNSDYDDNFAEDINDNTNISLEKKSQCTICSEEFNNFTDLEEHVMIHTDDRS